MFLLFSPLRPQFWHLSQFEKAVLVVAIHGDPPIQGQASGRFMAQEQTFLYQSVPGKQIVKDAMLPNVTGATSQHLGCSIKSNEIYHQYPPNRRLHIPPFHGNGVVPQDGPFWTSPDLVSWGIGTKGDPPTIRAQ